MPEPIATRLNPGPLFRSLVDHPGAQMALATFAILVIELALIRWVGSQIRIAAYFANLVLIAAFLGMGLGVALGQRRPRLFPLAFAALTLLVVVLSLSEPMGFTHISFPDPAISLWGGEAPASTVGAFLISLAACRTQVSGQAIYVRVLSPIAVYGGHCDCSNGADKETLAITRWPGCARWPCGGCSRPS